MTICVAVSQPAILSLAKRMPSRGDALQTLAFSILSDAPMAEVSDRDRLAMVSELAMASGVAGMCGGQALDLEAEGRQVNLEQLERIHRHKTGALIRAAVRPAH